MNTNLTAAHVLKQVQFKYGEDVAKQIEQLAQNVADGLGAAQLFNLEELKLAGARIRVKGTVKEAAELVDMLVAAGDQRGDMMLEYTKQATCEAFRALLKELGVPVPCDCGKPGCEGEMQEGCGHLANVEQLEFNASLEERIDDDGLR